MCVDRGVLGEQGHLYPSARSRLGPRLRERRAHFRAAPHGLRCCFHWRLSCGRGAFSRVRGWLCLDPIAALGATRVDLPGNLADDLLCGRRIPVERALADFDTSKSPFALVLDEGLKALARIESGRFVMEHVFPQAIGGVR